MNPWGQTPSIKKFPLGEVQRILYNSNSYKAYNSENNPAKAYEDEEGNKKLENEISTECENILRINTEITELNSNFESLELFLKYNKLVSDESVKQRIKCIEELNLILSNINKAGILAKTTEKQEKIPAERSFLTVDYAYRKVLIQMLKLIKQNERQLEKGKPLGVRDENEIKDLLNYFYVKGGKTEGFCQEVLDLCQEFVSQNERLVNLFNKY